MTRAQKTMLPLGIASIFMLISLFFSSKIAGLGLLLWVLTVGWTMSKTMFSNTSIDKLVKHNDKLIGEAWEKKKITETSVRMLAIPMSVIGLIIVFLNIALLFLM